MDEVQLEKVNLEEYFFSYEEWTLINALDKVAFAAHRTAAEMEAMHEKLGEFAGGVSACRAELEEYYAVVESMMAEPPEAKAGGMETTGMFKIQKWLFSASQLESEARSYCTKALRMSEKNSVKLEGAHMDQGQRLFEVLSSPKRRSTAARVLAVDAGMEMLFDKLKQMERMERTREGAKHAVPSHLLRGKYPTEDDPPPVHTFGVERNTFGSRSELLMHAKLRKEAAEAATDAAKTIDLAAARAYEVARKELLQSV